MKVSELFQIMLWKFYYKLINNMLPSYFHMLKPNMPLVSSDCSNKLLGQMTCLEMFECVRRAI